MITKADRKKALDFANKRFLSTSDAEEIAKLLANQREEIEESVKKLKFVGWKFGVLSLKEQVLVSIRRGGA